MSTFILDNARVFNFQYQIGVIPCNAIKQPVIDSVVDKRGALRTEEELQDWFGPTGTKRAQYLAALLDSPRPLCAIDLDGTGLTTFMTKLLPRCSEQLQKVINTTMRTQTPSKGLHLIFRYTQEDYPSGIKTHKYWNDLGPDKEHNEINLMGINFYLVERGPGYESIIGPEAIVTLSKIIGDELTGLLRKFESETQVIRYLCQQDNLIKYYQKDNRDNLVFHLSGYLHKNGVPEYLIHDLIECLIDSVGGDEETESRLDVITKTCAKRPDEVSGRTELLSALNGDQLVFSGIKNQFKQLGYINFTYDSGSSGNSNNTKKTRKKNNQDNEEEEKVVYEYVQKYSNNNLLAEAVIVGNNSRFAVIRPNASSGITLEKELALNDERNTILKPLDEISYMNKPYVFGSEEEFYAIVDLATEEDLDSLYEMVKAIWKKYIDADDNHLSICAADTIFTYFQDKIGMTHYLFFVGDNDSGKSNNLVVIHMIGYRNLLSIGVSVANIYQFLGSRDEGAGTLCEDEANQIDEDKDKMEIAKSGYTKGYPVIRTTTTPFGRIQYRYNTFCFKAYSAEQAPDSIKAKGLVQRLIKLKCTVGNPANDILEVINHADDDNLKSLFDELAATKNLLLCYRMLHYHEKIPDIKVNLKNRERQLFKPVLRLFQGTNTFNHLCNVIAKYVKERRSTKVKSYHAFLCKLIQDMITEKGFNNLQSAQSTIASFSTSDIWAKVATRVSGLSIPGKPLSYDTVEFGVISQRTMTKICEDVFKAEYVVSNSERRLIFDKNLLKNIASTYAEDEVKIKIDSNFVSTDSTLSTHYGNAQGDKEQERNEETEPNES